MPEHKKLLFEYRTSGDETEIESLWAIPVENGYQVDNIPFYVTEIALDDVVSATPDNDGMLRFQAVLIPSGHSTIRLWFGKNKESEVASVRDRLRHLGCSSEVSDLPRLIAVDVPRSVPYESIRAYLDQSETEGLFEYEEACLGSS